MSYRINYGNGQVHGNYSTRKAADRDLAIVRADCASAFVQVYIAGSADEPGDWFRARKVAS